MYVELPLSSKCSNCGAMFAERVTISTARGSTEFLRCRSCGHEGEKREIVVTTTHDTTTPMMWATPIQCDQTF